MKKIISIFLAAASFLSISCAIDPLDQDPLSSLSPEEFFSSTSGLEAFSNNFYTAFPASGLYAETWDMYAATEMSDEMRGGRTVPTTWSWGTLRNINTLLGNLQNCKDEEAVKYYDALARFFRAYFYFGMIQKYGDVPWYDRELGSDDPELYKPRDSREYVMQKIIVDIDIAIENLPSQKDVYKITRWTALALKSRFCLFEGTFRKYHSITKYENDADYYLGLSASASYKFITESGYSIAAEAGDPEKNYRTLFTSVNANSTEVILARDYNAELGLTHSSGNSFNSATMGRYGMNKKVVASYLMKDGSRFTDIPGWETMTFMEEVKDRDPRLAQSIITPGFKFVGETVSVGQNLTFSTTGYNPTKYVTTIEHNGYDKSDIDLIIFRAAEVYLNYAEAKAELSSDAITQNDLDISINRLRDRVGMPHLSLTDANANPDPFLKNKNWGGYQNVATGGNEGVILEIRRERMVELAQEGHRYYDIIRWKEGKIFEQPLYGIYIDKPVDGYVVYDFDGDGSNDLCVYQENKPNKVKATVFYKAGKDVILSEETYGYIHMQKGMGKWAETRDYLYPIPSVERSLNPNLTQNPGWVDGLDY
jgi:hypothetical protein